MFLSDGVVTQLTGCTNRIESEDGYWGWVMPTEHPQYTRVAVRQLRSTMTMPPMFPPTMLWLIERIE